MNALTQQQLDRLSWAINIRRGYGIANSMHGIFILFKDGKPTDVSGGLEEVRSRSPRVATNREAAMDALREWEGGAWRGAGIHSMHTEGMRLFTVTLFEHSISHMNKIVADAKNKDSEPLAIALALAEAYGITENEWMEEQTK